MRERDEEKMKEKETRKLGTKESGWVSELICMHSRPGRGILVEA